MKNNLITFIFLSLIAPILLFIVASPQVTSKPVTEVLEEKSVTPASINPGSSNWSGLGMCLFYDQVYIYADTLLANGFTELRMLVNYNNTEYLEGLKAAAIAGTAKGAKIICGVSSNQWADPSALITSSNWPAFRAAILDMAQWAQDNGIYEFQIGNEEEYHVDGTTMTVAQMIINLKSVATEVQSIFTRGNVSYSCAHNYISDWVATGKGDIDLLASNIYMEYDDYKTDLWKTEINTLVDGFGTNGTYITEFSLNNSSLAKFSTNEEEQVVALSEMIEYIRSSGITRAIFFCLRDDEFGVLKGDGTYRKLWDGILRSQYSL